MSHVNVGFLSPCPVVQQATPMSMIGLPQLLLFLVATTTVTADCDLSGLCVRLQHLIHQNKILCNAEDECLYPLTPDCYQDMATPNEFYCDPTDCVVIQTLATSLPGCREHFPNIRNTVMEEHSMHPLSDEFPADSFDQTSASPDKPILRDGQLMFHSALRKKKN